MSIDHEIRPEIPRTPDEILREVGVKGEELVGKKTLFLGKEKESLEGKIPDASITDFNLQYYIETDEVDMSDADFALAVGMKEMENIMGNPDREDLFAVIVQTVHSDGEVRIAVPAVRDDEEKPDTELLADNLAMLLYYNYGIERAIESLEHDTGSYLRIVKKSDPQEA